MTRGTKAMATLALAAALLAIPTGATAHCDSMDGPVVQAARLALETGEVAGVLKWVRAGDEPEVRAAFHRTLRVRAEGGEAVALAERWFFETVVRIHREGEGAPYTGLRPPDYQAPGAVTAADRALVTGSVDDLAGAVTSHLERALRERYEQVRALGDHDPADIEAGRRYVHAYVEYIHLVEAVHLLLSGDGGHGH